MCRAVSVIGAWSKGAPFEDHAHPEVAAMLRAASLLIVRLPVVAEEASRKARRAAAVGTACVGERPATAWLLRGEEVRLAPADRQRLMRVGLDDLVHVGAQVGERAVRAYVGHRAW